MWSMLVLYVFSTYVNTFDHILKAPKIAPGGPKQVVPNPIPTSAPQTLEKASKKKAIATTSPEAPTVTPATLPTVCIPLPSSVCSYSFLKTLKRKPGRPKRVTDAPDTPSDVTPPKTPEKPPKKTLKKTSVPLEAAVIPPYNTIK
jgi:hypothetical protein